FRLATRSTSPKHSSRCCTLWHKTKDHNRVTPHPRLHDSVECALHDAERARICRNHIRHVRCPASRVADSRDCSANRHHWLWPGVQASAGSLPAAAWFCFSAYQALMKDDDLSIGCPTCGSPAGEVCVPTTGEQRTTPRLERQ